jgi:23S rRNA U2552 (ribose-2'-O)-methylase RlmE/FtsJ
MKYLISQSFPNETNETVDDLRILEYLRCELNKTKSKIDEHYKEWRNVKSCIHDYEYVYHSSYRKKNVSRVCPVSRSYFKFREFFYDFDLNIEDITNVCNLAEAPGGFIESLVHLSGKKEINIHANSLLSLDKSIPLWNNKIKGYKINYLYGSQGTGDICDFLNIISMIKKVGKSTCELITGDGGFDYSSDYSNQEKNSLRLIYSEIFIAINLQRSDGNFICKIFDTFDIETLKLLYLLKLSYERVYLYKPKTSRNSNSEKYIVCLKFKGYNKEISNMMCRSFINLKLNIKLNKKFYETILKFIFDYTIKQVKSINNGISLINNGSMNQYPSKKQLDFAISWCKKYDIDVNHRCIHLNN